MLHCPVCHKQNLVTRQVGVSFLLCISCQESWPVQENVPEKRPIQTSYEFNELVRISRELVERAIGSWQTLREYSLEPPNRLPVMPFRNESKHDRIA